MKKTEKSMTSTTTDSVLDDAQLIERCIRGDRNSKERLARECLPLVRKLVYLGYGKHPDTEDVVQTALVAIFRDISELRNQAAFRTWMYRVTCNVIYSHGSLRSRLQTIFSLEPDMDARPSSSTATPETATLRTELFDRLSLHLKKIKYKKRVAVILSLFFGYVDTEIGEIMGCTSETAKKRVQHGRLELIRAVQKDPLCRKMMDKEAI